VSLVMVAMVFLHQNPALILGQKGVELSGDIKG